jgi:hypothetical protein
MAIEEAKKTQVTLGSSPAGAFREGKNLWFFTVFRSFGWYKKIPPKKKQKMVQPRLVALTLA